ncbi:MAG: hypothetical protein J6K77_08330 [Ruminococcus sp.]|nr:hypothetical protein [Ruminococcus sp.]
MKLRTRILMIVAILGAVLFAMGIGNTLLLIKGDTVDLTDPVSSFDDTALCQGKIDFVIGPFATLEETRKRYGVTTSKTETDFFLVSNLEEGTAFVVFSTGNKEMREKLTNASEKWEKFLEDESAANDEAPYVDIDFKGRLSKQYDDDDFDGYYNDVKNYLSLSASDCGKMRIVDGELSSFYPITTVAGGVAMLAGIIGLILGAVSDKKKKQQEELW